ncbi:hypothetical protein [Glaciihabitans tibetensis]|uniref:hypothetical protein n=1 Tax=Glaciihabitans tibetensis TaxID=1266600 RepID=UPI0015E664D4|nr:hypothetical protein [Glaciihabitans tibetensis]
MAHSTRHGNPDGARHGNPDGARHGDADGLRRSAARAPALLVSGGLALALLLTGCTGGDGSGSGGSSSGGSGSGSGSGDSSATESASPSQSPNTPDPAPNDSPLMAVYPAELTAASAEAETVRVADQIQALLDPSTILFVDDHPQLVDSSTGTGQYFGVLRILSLTESTDPVLLAKVLTLELKGAGWTEASVDATDGSYFVALVSSKNADQAWILQLGGDTSAEGNGAITLNLLSPTFP